MFLWTRDFARAVTIALLLPLGGSFAPAHGQSGGTVDRMYVLYCGEAHAEDQSRWSPGVNVGKPIDLSNNCYLVRHGNDLLLWESGYGEATAALPDGFVQGVLHWRVKKTLSAQLAEIGVDPSQITYFGFSHAHPDHIGNANLFSNATLYVQRKEYDAALGPEAKPYGPPANYDKLRNNKVVKLDGDFDVFGDGAVTILSTPGHTAGHQSLLVKLPKTGAVVLSGDAAHFRDNFDNRRVPVQNFSKEQTLQSMDKLAQVVAANQAQLWITHDSAQAATLRKSPEYYE